MGWFRRPQDDSATPHAGQVVSPSGRLCCASRRKHRSRPSTEPSRSLPCAADCESDAPMTTNATASLTNLVERWFAELSRRLLKRGTHHSVNALERDVRAWTATGPQHGTKTRDDSSGTKPPTKSSNHSPATSHKLPNQVTRRARVVAYWPMARPPPTATQVGKAHPLDQTPRRTARRPADRRPSNEAEARLPAVPSR